VKGEANGLASTVNSWEVVVLTGQAINQPKKGTLGGKKIGVSRVTLDIGLKDL